MQAVVPRLTYTSVCGRLVMRTPSVEIEDKLETETERVCVLEINSDCTCEEYDEETGESKVDENGYPVMSDYCYGCYDDDLVALKYDVLPEWLGANGWDTDTRVTIRGSRMGWTNDSGYLTTTIESAEKLLDKLRINGDYTLRFYRKGKNLEVVRSSHDELGALFEFELAEESDEDY